MVVMLPQKRHVDRWRDLLPLMERDIHLCIRANRCVHSCAPH